jgi:hypothetical protein
VHRDDNKSADILTNDSNLFGSLSYFRCDDTTCPYYGKEHPVTTNSNNNRKNNSTPTSPMHNMIPSQLAEEVAECVHSKFYYDRIKYKSNIILTTKEEQEFNLRTERK